jgi:hypothetical protein
MNILIFSSAVTSVMCLVIFFLELWKAKTPGWKRHPPRFVDCGVGLRSGSKVNYKELWISPDFITSFDYDGNFQFLLVYASTHPIIFHAVRGDNRDGEGWHIYQVEYATVLETLKEANRIIDASKHAKQ